MQVDDDDVAFYQDNGYLLVRQVFTMEEVEAMRRATDAILQRAAETHLDKSHTWQGTYLPPEVLKQLVVKGFHDVHYHDAVFTRALAHPQMVAVLTRLIGPNVQLHHSKMLVKPPARGAAFPLHQDYPYFPHRLGTMLAASVHLDDADQENGCLAVVPGSHRQGPLDHVGSYYLDPDQYPLSSAVSCPAAAGDVLFFTALTVHGSSVNQSQRVRRNVLFQYRDPEDQPLADVHVNWGQGLMVAGHNPTFREYHADHHLQSKHT